MLIRTQQLDSQQLKQLDVLSNECKQVDGNTIPFYPHLLCKDRIIPSNLLFYKQQQLVGFLSAFFFYEDACEITMMVSPLFRHQGIAALLLYEISRLLTFQPIQQLIFSTPHGVNDAWFLKAGFQYKGSEYQMRMQQTSLLPLLDKSLTIRVATDADIPMLCAIDEACFPRQQTEMPLRFSSLLNDANYTIFIAHQHGVPVGKAHIFWQNNDSVRLTDIAILPRVQGLGFGSELIKHCINHCVQAQKTTLILEVETSNKNALKLYTRLGFAVHNAHDYWTISINWLDRLSIPPLVLQNKIKG